MTRRHVRQGIALSQQVAACVHAGCFPQAPLSAAKHKTPYHALSRTATRQQHNSKKTQHKSTTRRNAAQRKSAPFLAQRQAPPRNVGRSPGEKSAEAKGQRR